MTYETAEALRMALEQRLNNRSRETGISLDRLRRRVVFERIVARLAHAEPGRWVLKGGMALEVRLRDQARLTKDIDLGLRDGVNEQAELHERLVEALAADPFNDRFVLVAGPVTELSPDGGGHTTWRSSVAAQLAGRPFGGVQIDVSPRAHELDLTDTVALPNSLAFADIEAPAVEIIDVNRHAAEKFHAMLRQFDDRENTRVRDLLDLVLLIENELLDRPAMASAVRDVWQERDATARPKELAVLPASWPDRYERLAAEHDVTALTFPAAVALVTALWTDLTIEET
ncbi:MAG: nucleotidyl transferase AbiEii/AbiGii toxin family protein [Tetrasphaera sp.]|nr:nucleotidyl transferase AbiEii/AbiGii toxin family protein [Microthrixaceae bacterium]